MVINGVGLFTVPLVSRILPSDVCRIHKRGSSIRCVLLIPNGSLYFCKDNCFGEC